MRIDSDDDSSSVASEETFEELAPRSPSMDFGSSPPRRSRALKGVVDTRDTRRDRRRGRHKDRRRSRRRGRRRSTRHRRNKSRCRIINYRLADC